MARIALWGDGAVGTGLSVALAGAGHEVLLIGPPGSGRGEVHLQASGTFQGSVRIDHLESGDPVQADACLVAVKAYDLEDVAGPASGAAPIIICACNGMGLENSWGRGWEQVERIVMTSGFELIGEGRVTTFPGQVYVSSHGMASNLFRSTGLHVDPVEHIENHLWAKWLVNSVINPFGAITGVVNSRLYSLGLEVAMKRVFTELANLIPDGLRSDVTETASGMIAYLTEFSANRCSMLQDLHRGSKTEIDFLTGYAEKKKPGTCPLARLLSDLVRGLASTGASPS